MTLILSGTDGVSDVDGTAATPAVRGADANTGIFFPAADTIAFAEGGAEVARITNTGAWSFGASGTATGTNGQVLTSAGSGAAPAWATPAVTAPAGTTGQVQINSSGAFGAVGSGTTGQVLTSQGAGAAPVFATPAGGGSWIFLSALTASNSATLTYDAFTGDYDIYAITLSSLIPSASGITLRCNPRYPGNDTETNNRNAFATVEAGSSGFSLGTSDSNGLLGLTVGPASNNSRGVSGTVYFANPSTTSGRLQFWYHTVSSSPTSLAQFIVGGSHSGRVGAAIGFRLNYDTGNIASGVVRIYGIKNS